MGKREFLEVLGERLAEELPRELVINHLEYYENYIDIEIQKGRKASEVMTELGDPILIAHTIINTETGESFQGYAEDAEFVEIPSEDEPEQVVYEEEDVEYTHLHTENEEERQAGEYEQNSAVQKKGFKAGCLIAAIVGVLVLIGILSLVGSLISILLPILLPVIVVVLVISLVGRKNN